MLNYPESSISFSKSLNLAKKDKSNIFLSLNHLNSENDSIPYAIKDNICTLGLPTTCASGVLKGYESPYEATVVKRLNEKGCSQLGKTNLDEFAMGASTETGYYGPCLNPWNKKKVCGGSSGGSAAAVAAGIVPFSLGSDTGGSVRQPASFCGVFGFRPTWGRVSRYGLVSMTSSMDTIGIFSKTLQETRWVFDAVKGSDRNDSTSYDIEKNVSFQEKKPKKILIPNLSSLKKFTKKYIFDSFKNLLSEISKEKIEIQEMDFDIFENSLPVYYLICYAEVSSNLARFDGVRFGPKHDESVELWRKESFGPEVQRRILMGCHVLSEGYRDGLYEKAVLLRESFSSILNNWAKEGVFLLPTTPSVAFDINSKKDPLSMYQQDIFTTVSSLAGVPAINIPWGKHEGMPYGFQLSSGENDDEDLINQSLWLENFSKWRA